LTAYGFTTLSAGNLNAVNYNEVPDALGDLSAYITGTLPTTLNSGDDLTAANLNGFVTCMNSIT
jgi:hypothetical protein